MSYSELFPIAVAIFIGILMTIKEWRSSKDSTLEKTRLVITDAVNYADQIARQYKKDGRVMPSAQKLGEALNFVKSELNAQGIKLPAEDRIIAFIEAELGSLEQ